MPLYLRLPAIVSLDLGAGASLAMLTRALVLGDTTQMLVAGLVASGAVGTRITLRVARAEP
jgi:hypothetical protein